MAAQTELEVVIKARDEASEKLRGLSSAANTLGKNFAIAGGAITTAFCFAISKTIDAEAATNRLTQIVKTSRNATDEQVKSLLNQADALEKVGVVGRDAVVQAQAQLATFDLEVDSIEKLTPAILNYATAEKGANVSTEELRSMTNGLAQALQGNFASLTKTGFVLDEATKKTIANGTQTERVAALVKVLDSTYKGFNETSRETSQGALIALQNEFGNLQTQIGAQLLPILADLVKQITPIIEAVIKWTTAHPELTRVMVIVTAAVGALMLALSPLLLLLPALTTAVGAFGAVLAFVAANPIILIIAAIVALITAIVLLIKNWDLVSAETQKVWNFITAYLQSIWDRLKNMFNEGLTGIRLFWQDTWIAIKDWLFGIWDSIVGKVQSAMSTVTNLLAQARAALSEITSIASTPIKAAGGVVSSAVKAVGKAIGVKDAIITPDGRVITTDPADFLIATKTPGALVGAGAGGGGENITVNINGGTYLSESVALDIGNMIVRRLKLVSKIRV